MRRPPGRPSWVRAEPSSRSAQEDAVSLTIVSVWVDQVGQVAAKSLTYVTDDDKRSYRPVGVAPFETPAEAFQDLLARVDVQERRW